MTRVPSLSSPFLLGFDEIERAGGRGQLTIRLPDGLDSLVAHNLITFKSLREAWMPGP